jgi:cGMP-dependent protein kinase 2
MIYFEGDKSDVIYLVRDGVFQISKKMNVGSRWKNIPIVEIGSNQLFGDLECLLNKPRYFNVKCLSPGTCFKISNDEFY